MSDKFTRIKKTAELGVALSAISVLLAGCLGGGSATNAGNTTTFSGTVIDGYLQGATVCLDTNSNGMCDPGEPNAVTNASGVYSLSATSAQAASAAVVAEVPATAIDADTASAVGAAFTLTAPAGASAVTPLTALVHDKMQGGLSQASAVVAVQQALSVASGVQLTEAQVMGDYVKLKGTATAQTDANVRAHEAAKTVVAALKEGRKALGLTGATTERATLKVLLAEAESVLQAQGATFSPLNVVASSVSGAGTLKSQIALAKASVDAAATTAAATQAVTINFDVVNGASAVGVAGCALNSLTLGLANASGVVATGSIKDLRFYVSNVALIDAAGNYSPLIMDINSNQDKNVALMDFEDGTNACSTGTAATYTAISGKVAPGSYVGLAFDIGVPAQLNHTAVAGAATPPPLQNSSMNWSWQGGRKFTKIEFTGNAASGAATTMVHLGSTGCKANPANGQSFNGCASPNRLHVVFPTGFYAATSKVALDLGALFSGLDLTASRTWMSGKSGMMAMDATYYFNKLQIDKVTGLPINDGAAQTVFKKM